MLIACPTITCPGTDFPITNYSSEGEEPFPPYTSVVYPPEDPPTIDGSFFRQGCLYACISELSQEDADLCALRQVVLCSTPPDEPIWYSAEAACTAVCPDGREYTYVVPAGSFVAPTLQQAQDQAQAYACNKAELGKLCLGDIQPYACIGNNYSSTVPLTPSRSGLAWSLVGSLPPGLQFVSNTSNAVIVGVPTTAGVWAFRVMVVDGTHFAERVYTIKIATVLTSFLNDGITGGLYYDRLDAYVPAGASTWAIESGTLPPGLTLNQSTGEISGTPTVAGTYNFTVCLVLV